MCCVDQAQQTFADDGGDEAFKSWLVCNIGSAFAEKIPDLLASKYDDEAWTEAMLADIEARLTEASA